MVLAMVNFTLCKFYSEKRDSDGRTEFWDPNSLRGPKLVVGKGLGGGSLC